MNVPWLKVTCISYPGRFIREGKKREPGLSWCVFEKKSTAPDPVVPLYLAETFDECIAEIRRREGAALEAAERILLERAIQ